MSATIFATIEAETCGECGVVFGLEASYRKKRINDHSIFFYCPNGHHIRYSGKSDVEKRAERAEQEAVRLQNELSREKDRRVSAEKDVKVKSSLLGKAKAQKARLEKRIAHGVCPECNRTFQQLARHMASKHPNCKGRRK